MQSPDEKALVLERLSGVTLSDELTAAEISVVIGGSGCRLLPSGRQDPKYRKVNRILAGLEFETPPRVFRKRVGNQVFWYSAL